MIEIFYAAVKNPATKFIDSKAVAMLKLRCTKALEVGKMENEEKKVGVKDAVVNAVEEKKAAVENTIDATKSAVEDKIDATKTAVEDKIDATKNAVEEKKAAVENAVENKIDSARNFFAGGLSNLANKIAADKKD